MTGGTMTLSPGTRLGPYEIVAPLGAGGIVPLAREPSFRGKHPVRAQADEAPVVWREAAAEDVAALGGGNRAGGTVPEPQADGR